MDEYSNSNSILAEIERIKRAKGELYRFLDSQNIEPQEDEKIDELAMHLEHITRVSLTDGSKVKY